VLTDGTHRIEIYTLANNPHAVGLLAVYLPSQRLLIEADAFSPSVETESSQAPSGAERAPAPPPPEPGAVNLYENIRRWDISVERIMPLHGNRMATLAELAAATGKGAPQAPQSRPSAALRQREAP
jgi:hypothetical protein